MAPTNMKMTDDMVMKEDRVGFEPLGKKSEEPLLSNVPKEKISSGEMSLYGDKDKEEKRKYEDIDEYHVNNDCSKALSALMILVNSSIAKFFADNKYPFLYRVNSSDVDDELIGDVSYAIHASDNVISGKAKLKLLPISMKKSIL